MNEFEIIKHYFDWGVGIGDDCAVIDIDNTKQLVTTVDTLIQNVHFPENTSATDIAYKSLAVNLSDLAAMGATPKYFTLALTLPKIDKKWLSDFSKSLKFLAKKYNIDLVGGDTTKGHLSISINATGVVNKNQALLRSNAKIGDGIFVSGVLGAAALALEQINNSQVPQKNALQKLNRPNPRVDLGLKIKNFANSCIDLSDGLSQDLSHILNMSNVGGKIYTDKIPIFKGASLENALCGGDDYELCWTGDINSDNQIEDSSQIGIITKKTGLYLDDKLLNAKAYQHF